MVSRAPAGTDAGPLVAHDLWRTHRTRRGTVTALAGVDLTVGAGERIGVVGASGSGKTTLMRTLLALEAPDRGALRWGDRPVRPGPVRRLRWYRRRVQYVAQDPSTTLDPRRTVAQSLRQPLARLAVPGDHPAMMAAALADVGLPDDVLGRRPGELSGGQCQRVAVARAVVVRPAVLLADEPVSGLDPQARALVLTLLHDLSVSRGTALVLVSHDLSAVGRWCARTLVLDAGRIVEQGPTERVLTDPTAAATRHLLASRLSLDGVPR